MFNPTLESNIQYSEHYREVDCLSFERLQNNLGLIFISSKLLCTSSSELTSFELSCTVAMVMITLAIRRRGIYRAIYIPSTHADHVFITTQVSLQYVCGSVHVRLLDIMLTWLHNWHHFELCRWLVEFNFKDCDLC